MARVTVEDCLARVPNRFALTILAARRARMLEEGRGEPLVECDNKEGVTALREIAVDGVRYEEDVTEVMMEFVGEQRRQLRVTSNEHTFLEAASLRALEADDEDEEAEDDDDVEELPSDPEQLGKKAKAEVEDDDEEEVDEEDEEAESDDDNDGEDAADFDADGLDDLADDDDESDDDDDDD